MLDITLQNIIEIYAWTAAGLTMIFITAIAKFYQKKFGIRTFYYFYPLTIIILFIAAFHLFSYRTSISESIELIGSVGSFLVSFFLYRLMVGVK